MARIESPPRRRTSASGATWDSPSAPAQSSVTASTRGRRSGDGGGSVAWAEGSCPLAAASSTRAVRRSWSSLPLGPVGNSVDATIGRGIEYSGRRSVRWTRSSARRRSGSMPGAGRTAAARRAPEGVRRTTTAAWSTPGRSPITHSTSAGSTRWPRILTWRSVRPAKTRSPSGRRRHRSPVR